MTTVNMTECEACKTNLSNQAERCPQCGHPNKKATKPLGCLQIIAGLVVFIVLLAIFFGSSNEKEIAKEIGSIDEQVVNDAITEYQIAKNQGDRIQTCVQAGMVSAAYLQAKDEPNYKKWKAIEKRDCEATENME